MVLTLKPEIKHEFVPKPIDYPTQTKGMLDRDIDKATATDMSRTSFIDVVIENKVEGNEHSAVYIRPSYKDISYILKNTKAKNKESKEKYLEVLELKNRFCRAMPQYYDEFVFDGIIFWFAYPRALYDRLKTTARTI